MVLFMRANLSRRPDLTPARPPSGCELRGRAPPAWSAEVRAPFAADSIGLRLLRAALLAALRRVRQRPTGWSLRRVWTGCPRARRALRLQHRSVAFLPASSRLAPARLPGAPQPAAPWIPQSPSATASPGQARWSLRPWTWSLTRLCPNTVRARRFHQTATPREAQRGRKRPRRALLTSNACVRRPELEDEPRVPPRGAAG
jgi:hypothetical protein